MEIALAIAELSDPNPTVVERGQCTIYTRVREPQFTTALLEIIADTAIDTNTRTAAARIFAERVYHHYHNLHDDMLPALERLVRFDCGYAHRKLPEGCYFPQKDLAWMAMIPPDEQELVTARLLPLLKQTCHIKAIRSALVEAFFHVAIHEPYWPKAIDGLLDVIGDATDLDRVVAGLAAMVEFVNIHIHRAIRNIPNQAAEAIVPLTSPLFETLIPRLLRMDLAQLAKTLSLVLQVIRHQSAAKDVYVDKLGAAAVRMRFDWLQDILRHPQMAHLKTEASHPWIEVMVWCIRVVPEYPSVSSEEKFRVFWSLVERWTSGKLWLPDEALYYLIIGINNIDYAHWPLVKDNFTVLIKQMMVPLLSFTSEAGKIREQPPVTTTSSSPFGTPIVSSALRKLVDTMAERKQTIGIEILVATMTEIFEQRARDKLLISVAQQTAAAMTMFEMLVSKPFLPPWGYTPVIKTEEEANRLFMEYIYPELSPDTMATFPWLAASARFTVSVLSLAHYRADKSMTQKVFEAVKTCYDTLTLETVRMLALRALIHLGELDFIKAQLAPEASQLFEGVFAKLQEKPSTNLLSILVSLAARYAEEMAPHTPQYVSNLLVFFDKHSSEDWFEADYVLKTMLYLIEANCDDVDKTLELRFVDVVKLCLDHRKSTTYQLVPIVHKFATGIKSMRPELWDLYKVALDASLVTEERFPLSHFLPFFIQMVIHGYGELQADDAQLVSTLIWVCLYRIEESYRSEGPRGAFELLELIIPALGGKFTEALLETLGHLIHVFFDDVDDLQGYDGQKGGFLVVRVMLTAFIASADDTLKVLANRNAVDPFLKVWDKYHGQFRHDYAIKLQILAALLILLLKQLEVLPMYRQRQVYNIFQSALRDYMADLDHPGQGRHQNVWVRDCEHSPSILTQEPVYCDECLMAYLDYQSTFLKPNFSPIYAMNVYPILATHQGKAKQWIELYG